MNKGFLLLVALLILGSCEQTGEEKDSINSHDMMVRLSEIEIEPNFLDEYVAILKEESEASVRLEKGVISIYPMFQKDKPNEIRILEIYASKEAYESHLQTPHFKNYKSTTLKMVKSLKLIDMKAIDVESMPSIFEKIGEIKISNCVERIFEQDSILGGVRNHASENGSLSDALYNYTRDLESLDYSNCPHAFVTAFQQHIDAWKKVTKITNKYPSLRGELHDIFFELEKSKDSTEFKGLVKQVWETWAIVEDSSK